jgi:hypothetical protein
VSEAELAATLNRGLSLANLVSKALSPKLTAVNVALHDGAQNVTLPSGVIRISRAQLREGLVKVKDAAADSDAGMAISLKRQLEQQLVSVLLHEASHSLAIAQGTYLADPIAEQIRNSTALIKRVIGALTRLKLRLDGTPAAAPADSDQLDPEDAEAWFKRLETTILHEEKYRMRFLKRQGAAAPLAFQQATAALDTAFTALQAQLATIYSGTSTDAQKIAAVEAAVYSFQQTNASNIGVFAGQTGLIWELNLQSETGGPGISFESTGTFDGEAIPSLYPRDPALAAPPIDRTTATPLLSQVEFLFSGPNAIQTGVGPGVIEQARVAVLRGRVVTASGAPLPGVRVNVSGHGELGQTLTRQEGKFDLVVNGGQTLILDFSHAD